MTIEMQVVPQAPYTDEIIAAYKSCKESYANYFSTSRLQSLGLATLPADIVVPSMSEEAFIEMGKKISDYEVSKVTIEKANAEALVEAQKQYKLLEKLLLLCRDYCTILRNFVSFQDFYAKRVKSVLGRNADDESPWAIFQVGTLLIDQRACNLCLRVTDLSKHNVQAPDSGMFLIYCHCTLHLTGETMQIVAAMTVGDVRNIKVGKNALFYDRQGRDWEAEVIKVIDNPISIGQAFWSPYRKVADWVIGLVNKSVEEKEKKNFSEATTKIQATADKTKSTKVPEKVAPFDIAKFAGIFAAIGMALGMIGTALVSVAEGFAALTWWQAILVIVGIVLFISGPSMVMAWLKLRRRNIAPILNANGWAMNASSIVNITFGGTLTEIAHFPKIKMQDPFAKKKMAAWKKWLIVISVLLVLAGAAVAVWFYFDNKKEVATEKPCVEQEQVIAEEVATEVAE
jgi:hypothetical protein